ncbi:MAG: hypothetical protein ABIQ16_06560 [Polyangiaceae bacterium]
MSISPIFGTSSVDAVELKLPNSRPAKAVESAFQERTDKVTLSPEARERAAAVAVTSDAGKVISRAAHADASAAEQLAKDFAFTADQPELDMTDFFAGKGPMKYASTGEPVTAESEAAFGAQEAKARHGRIALYQSEKQKGTPPADIYDKIVAYMDTQPSDFIRNTGWKNLLEATPNAQ